MLSPAGIRMDSDGKSERGNDTTGQTENMIDKHDRGLKDWYPRSERGAVVSHDT